MTTNVQLTQLLHAHPADTAYWRRLADTAPDPTVLVRDFLGRDAASPTATIELPLDPAGVATVARLGRDDPTLTRLVYGAVLGLVAARATDRERVVFLIPGPGGANPTVPVAVPVAGDATFRQLLGAVRTAYLDAAAHLGVPAGAVLGRALTDFALSVDSDVALDAVAGLGGTLRFDVGHRDGAGLRLSYRTDLFDPSTAERLAVSFARILRAVTLDPGTRLARLSTADGAERSWISKFNDTTAEFPDTAVLHGFLERQAARTPDRVAILDDGSTFAQVNASANQIAHTLVAHGVGPGDVVGVCLPRSPLLLRAIYGILKAGGAYLPVDPALPENRIDYMLGHSGARIVVGDGGTPAVARSVGMFVDLSDPEVSTQDTGNPGVRVGAGDLCYVIYTSGSTGRPKGVMIEHRAIVNRLIWMQKAYPLDASDVILHKTPFTFDVSVWEIFWWSIAGAAVSTLPSGHEKDPDLIAARIAESGVTTMHFVPSMLRAFVGYLAAAGATGRLDSLRRVFASGEALATDQVRAFAEVAHRNTSLINLYGPTEAAVDVTSFDCADADPRRSVPIGRPIDNTRLHILTRSGEIAPIGTPGELCIAGTNLARGYLNADDLTGQRFVPDVTAPDGRMYRTGDLARWLSDGSIEYLGRIDAQVKIRGFRIELGEIEHVAKNYPGLVDCAVTALSDAAGDRYLCAYVVAGPGLRTDGLLAHLAAELPAYMVPAAVVEVPAIPTNHNGKRDLGALPAPGPATGGTGYVAPRTDREAVLAGIWANALGLESVGVQDNFFALGGDSIKFIGVLAAVRAAGLDLSFQDLFAYPTIAELAVRMSTGDTVLAPPATAPFALLAPPDRDRLPAGIRDAYPMSALQAGLLYEAARGQGTGMYHDILSYRIDDRLDVPAFTAAVDEVVRRHPICRTSFHLDDYSEPIQIVHDAARAPLRVFDLCGLTEVEQRDRLARHNALELARGFVAGEPDLIRVRLDLLGERTYQYTLSYHDAALDGWSVNTIHRDLFAAYFARLDGRAGEAGEAARPAGYPDFVTLERESAGSEEHRRFWLDVMDGAETTRLPRYPSEDPKADGVVFHEVALGAGVSAAITRTAGELRVPVKSVLLAAHVAVLSFVCGGADVLTGYEHSGRPELAGSEQLAGLFLNTVALRVRLDDLSWADLVRAVYDAETRLLPYRRFPMAELKRALGSREPLFDTVFNFTHFHVLKDLTGRPGFELVRSVVNAQTEFPFRAEFSQDAITDEVGLSLHYHGDAFAAEQIERIAGYYTRALGLLTSHPGDDHRAATLLGDAERELLTVSFAGPVREPTGETFLDRFASQVRATPDAPAVRHRDEWLDYRALDAAADRVAALLAESGVDAGQVVAVVMERGIGWAVCVLAILKRGAVYLPQDSKDPARRRRTVLRRSGCRHVLTTTGLAESSRDTEVTVLSYEDAMGGTVVTTAPTPDDLAYLIFTSGSTGEPKGAMIRHSGMLNHLDAKITDLDLGPGDRVAQVATQCFDISIWQLLVAWLVGGETVIIDQDTVTDPAGFLDLVRERAITILEVVPSYLDALLTELQHNPRPLGTLRYTLVTGEAMPPSLTRRWFDHYRIPLVNAYGPTEASDDVTHHVIRDAITGDRVPVGSPILNTRVYVVDARNRPRPLGSMGEIVVTGIGVGKGYRNDADRTAAAFRPNTLDDTSPTLYRTGDVGRWLPGGVLDCAGRVDQQVKVRGFRIELSEIEGGLVRLPGVEHAVVLVREVGGEKLLAAFYTGSATPDLVGIRAALADHLPSYMLPDVAVALESFPLTGNGKVDRAALARHELAAPVRAEVEPPESALESTVVDVFAGVLGVPAGTIGVNDSLFDLGGHSITAMKVTARLDGVALRDVLAHPTPRALAGRLARGRAERRDLLVDLTEAAGAPVTTTAVTLVCIPFAGGNAVSYLPLARALHAAGLPVRVLGVELPGRTRDDPRPRIAAAELGEALAAELVATVATPIALLGHCAGTGPALSAARAMRRAGRTPRHLFAIAKVLKSTDPADHTDNEVVTMSTDEILDWMVANTGLHEIADLSDGARRDLAEAFRYDTAEATRAYATALWSHHGERLACPMTVVLADDDPLTRGLADRAQNWTAITTSADVVVIPGGGHYLNVTRPEALAAVIRDNLHHLSDRERENA